MMDRMAGHLKVLLVDDPMGSLSDLEEQLTQPDIDVVVAWDALEAEKRVASEKFDVVIASAICVSGDPIHFCLSCKNGFESPPNVMLYAPFPLNPDDELFIKGLGIDHVINSSKVKEILDFLRNNGHSSLKLQGECKMDNARAALITRQLYETAIKDLASKAKKLEEILENSSDVIYELDPYGKIILISKVIEKLTGYTRNELMGMSALDVTSADSIEVVADHISLLLSGQENPPAVEVGVQSKSGHVIPAEMIVRPIRHKNQVVGILGIGRNVEDRKRLEESLRRAANEKDFYLDLMAHDIQNFNQAIIGYLEMILQTEGLDPKLEKYAQGAFRQVMQTAQLIAHLKRIADVRNRGSAAFSRKDLKDVLQRSITNLQSRLDKRLIAITFDCADGEYPIMATEDINDLMDLVMSVAMRYSISDLLHIKISLSSEQLDGQKYWTINVSGNNLRLSAPVVKCMMSQDYTGCQMIERPDLQLLVARAIIEVQKGMMDTKYHESGRGDGFVVRIPQAQ